MRAFVLSLMLIMVPLWAAAEGTITVTGQGAASRVPDMAVLRLGVSARDQDAAAAMARVSDRIAVLFARMQGFGIAEADLQTAQIFVSPVYAETEPGANPDYAGFEAGNTLRVLVRDLAQLGDVLGAALEDGVNRLSGPDFALSDPQAATDEARRAAVSDARAKAELYAAAAGVTLGSVLSISEPGAAIDGVRPMMMETARSVPVAPGETEIAASVTVVFAIAP
jgi:uncharacterized protein YggE